MKICGKCYVPKPLCFFARSARSVDGHHGYCRECQAEYMRHYYPNNSRRFKDNARRWKAENPERSAQNTAAWRERNADRLSVLARRRRLGKYGLDDAMYAALKEWQEGGCAICGASDGRTGKSLNVDHDHETGATRGLLCQNCNVGLGNFQDSPRLLRIALAYLAFFGKL